MSGVVLYPHVHYYSKRASHPVSLNLHLVFQRHYRQYPHLLFHGHDEGLLVAQDQVHEGLGFVRDAL